MDHIVHVLRGVMGIYVGRWKAEDEDQGHIWNTLILKKEFGVILHQKAVPLNSHSFLLCL
jgi:hypothetical protein